MKPGFPLEEFLFKKYLGQLCTVIAMCTFNEKKKTVVAKVGTPPP
jgi:hypothetical protein